MIRFFAPLTSFVLAAVALAAAQSPGPANKPVLLELFTSEGCSSCPPADDLLRKLDATQPIKGADLIVLSEHVDYWNHDGWTDPYSSAALTARQNEYSQAFGLDEVYTPQLVVDGSQQVVGSRAPAVRDAVGKALVRAKLPVTIANAARQGGLVTAHLVVASPAGSTAHAAIYLALADNEDRSSVSAGENSGRALTHVAVLRTLAKVGNLDQGGFEKDLRIPVRFAAAGGLRLVVFVQDPSTRHVLGAAEAKI